MQVAGHVSTFGTKMEYECEQPVTNYNMIIGMQGTHGSTWNKAGNCAAYNIVVTSMYYNDNNYNKQVWPSAMQCYSLIDVCHYGQC